jgi:hypothetical protein
MFADRPNQRDRTIVSDADGRSLQEYELMGDRVAGSPQPFVTASDAAAWIAGSSSNPRS